VQGYSLQIWPIPLKKVVAAEQTALQQGKSRVEALQADFDRFYTGDIAQEMVQFYTEHGGLFTAKDFADYQPIRKPKKYINQRKQEHR